MRFSFKTFLLILVALAMFASGLLAVIGVWSFRPERDLVRMLNVPSVLIIIGGLSVHAMICFPVPELVKAMRGITLFASHKTNGPAEVAKQRNRFLEWQRLLKHDKTGKAEMLSEKLDGRFEGYLFSLLATNYAITEIRELGSAWINAAYDANINESHVMNTLGNASPAYGMLGTLMGLIFMLQNFQHADQLGAGLSLALMTTLYGLALAQFIWYPLAHKMRLRAEKIAEYEELTLQAFVIIAEDKPSLFIKDFFIANEK